MKKYLIAYGPALSFGIGESKKKLLQIKQAV